MKKENAPKFQLSDGNLEVIYAFSRPSLCTILREIDQQIKNLLFNAKEQEF